MGTSIEEEARRGEGSRVVLSMRAKMCLGGLCFFLVMSSVAYVKTPYLVTSLQRLAQNNTPPISNEPGIAPTFFLKDELDDLDSEGSNWFQWEESGGHVNSSDGYAYLSLDQGNSEICVSALTDLGGDWRMKWRYVTAEIRLRCGDDNGINSDTGEGQRAWGLGDIYPDWPQNFLIFNSHSQGSDESLVGFYAMIGINGSIIQQKDISHIDMSQWHNYTVIWKPGNATFLVDNETVFTTQQVPSVPIAVAVVTQNRRDNLLPGGIKELKEFFPLKQRQWIQIDYVHVYMEHEEYKEYNTTANQKLRQAQNTINSAKLGGLDTEGLEKDHAQAQRSLERDGHIPADLYVRILGTAQTLPIYLDQLTDLFAKAEEKIQTYKSEEKNTQYLETQLDKALKALRETEYTLAIYNLEKIMEE